MQRHSSELLRSAGACTFVILLAFSGVRAALAASTGFNDRVAECHTAAVRLLEMLGRPQEPALLRHISPDEYAALKGRLGGHPHPFGPFELGRLLFRYPPTLHKQTHRGNSTFVTSSRFDRCSDHLWAADERQDEDICMPEGGMQCPLVPARWHLAQATMQAQLGMQATHRRRGEQSTSSARQSEWLGGRSSGALATYQPWVC